MRRTGMFDLDQMLMKGCIGFSYSGMCRLFLLLWLVNVDDGSIRQSHFVVSPICVNQESIDNNCVTFTAMRVYSVECAIFCNANDSCVGASISNGNECYLHKECVVSITCDLMNSNFTHLVKSGPVTACLHDGKWHFGNKRCVCKDGWVGQYCETRAQTCLDILLDGYEKTYHRVKLDIHQDGSELIEVYCVVNPKKAYALVLANNGHGYFNRTWDEYVSGFGDTFENTWIGLHNFYLLSQIGQTQLHVRVAFEGFSESRYRRVYHDFVLRGDSDNYAFTFVGTHDTNGPEEAILGCLAPLQNSAFSTWDKDNDGDPGSNCAARYGAGWWYPDCNSTCNLAAYGSVNYNDELQGIDGGTMNSYFNYLDIMLSN